jgi:chemosensory pili system protein ChpA (sensor histidine kinase/response regulator)
VLLAKDGLDAMERWPATNCRPWCCPTSRCRAWTASTWCATCAPIRAWPLPVIMITSRIAQKHRDYAEQLGVDHYLGKPYDEDLLA